MNAKELKQCIKSALREPESTEDGYKYLEGVRERAFKVEEELISAGFDIDEYLNKHKDMLMAYVNVDAQILYSCDIENDLVSSLEKGSIKGLDDWFSYMIHLNIPPFYRWKYVKHGEMSVSRWYRRGRRPGRLLLEDASVFLLSSFEPYKTPVKLMNVEKRVLAALIDIDEGTYFDDVLRKLPLSVLKLIKQVRV
ncbi:hypothetical protein [Marinomonas sp. 2405UD68-3]|uniref:hypothetical protein n=1 Tax=Marinomonas sp. 2405UD68-3 TaxID=3391835 RepID=UPI0039C9120F